MQIRERFISLTNHQNAIQVYIFFIRLPVFVILHVEHNKSVGLKLLTLVGFQQRNGHKHIKTFPVAGARFLAV